MSETNITKVEADPGQIVKVQTTPMDLLQQAVAQGADPAVLEKMTDLYERWESSQGKRDFAEALAAFQAECPPIKKDRAVNLGGRGGYNYASLDDIMRVIQPVLSKHKISVGFTADVVEGMIKVICRVSHGIHTEETSNIMPVPTEMRVNATQQMGAALSYAKRYALCAALNIQVTDEDNDGGGLAETVTEEQAIQLQEIAQPIDGASIHRFMALMNAESWQDIPRSRFAEAKDLLNRKVKQIERARQEGGAE